MELKRCDPAAAAAAPVCRTSWSAVETERLLAAGIGKTGTSTIAFWVKACAACPVLGKRDAVRCHGLSVNHHAVSMGMQSTADGHASMLASMRVCGGDRSSMHVWRLSSGDYMELAECNNLLMCCADRLLEALRWPAQREGRQGRQRRRFATLDRGRGRGIEDRNGR